MTDVERLKHDRDYWDECDPTGGEATHYCAGGGHNPWIKDGHFWQDDKGCWRNSGLKIFIMPNPIPRPTRKQWSGPEDGLPPVGTECEVLMGSYWLHCEIIGRAEGKAWVRAIKTDEHWTIRSYQSFRPIKSEKERVMEAAIRVAGFGKDATIVPLVVGRLYDAGALKMPEEDQ